ncbi:helix-turn-helix domain-containing protein [Flavobacterium crassostreae]|uniref:HTH araC/xylS-type domain-containing protein n=1 Tax=Flavobacterium crassostreae TaxID=1763534 RepID=A0A1B9DYQ9_9FLAO|nr:AraC family transcriptional regulator [Flavobacterium crassostreae]OCB74831.1 hypothetical protein LPBF_09460 [Flavobacterium crassostreae]
MKNIDIPSGSLKQSMLYLKTKLNGFLDCSTNEFKLRFDSDLIKGSIEAISYSKEMHYINLAVCFTEDIRISLQNIPSLPSYFIYCSQGTVTHALDALPEKRVIKADQNIIISCAKAKAKNVFWIPKNTPTKIALIVVENHFMPESDSLYSKIQHTFFENRPDGVYYGIQNNSISTKIAQLRAVNQKGIVGNLLKKGILQIVLATEIEGFSAAVNSSKVTEIGLTKKQIEDIRLLSESIKKNPSAAYSLKSMSQKTGVSPNKLQEGFKIMHQTTVNDFITLVRIERAESLIRTSDLTISQIVYSIGFSSRSYFSKIFKQKYHCSPKQYKYSQNSLAITA